MMTEIYGTIYTWVGSVFDENMPLKVWQYIYGSDIITSRSDLVEYLSEVLTYGVLLAILLVTVLAFAGVIKLAFKVLRWW